MTDCKHTHRKTDSRSKSSRRNFENEQGAAFIELALSFLLFLSLFFLSIDVLRIGYNNALAQFIVTRAVQEGALLNGTNADRCTQIVQNVSDLIDSFGLDGSVDKANAIQVLARQGNSNTVVTSFGGDCLPALGTPSASNGNTDAGDPEAFFAIKLEYELPFTVGVLIQFNHTIEAIAVARNEPADVADAP